MTKPKPVAPKPILAWCLLDHEGNIYPQWINSDEATVAHWAKTFSAEIIRVEIRPAPKRKGARK